MPNWQPSFSETQNLTLKVASTTPIAWVCMGVRLADDDDDDDDDTRCWSQNRVVTLYGSGALCLLFAIYGVEELPQQMKK